MKRKRIRCLSVCVCLLLAMSPAAAFASESVPPDQQAAPTTEVTVTQPAAEPADKTVPGETVEKTEPSSEAPSTEPSSQEPAEPAESSQPSASEVLNTEQETTADPAEEVQSSTPAATANSQAAPAAKAAAASSAETRAPAVKKFAPRVTAKAKLSDLGIKVSGGIEGRDWEYQNGTLTLKKNGLTVSGTANDYLSIITAIAVSAVTFDNLKQGGNGKEIEIVLSGDKTAVTLKGKNVVSTILGGGISIAGTKNSQLTTEFLMSDSDLNVKDANLNSYVIHSNQDVNISNSKVTSDYLVANRDMNISGKSVITLDPSKNQNLPYSPSCLYTGRDLNVNLSEGGKIFARGFKFDKDEYPEFDFGEGDEVVPFLVGRNLNLSKTSRLSDGKTGTINALGYTFRGIVDAQGQPLETVSINGEGVNNPTASDPSPKTVQTAAAKTRTTEAAVGGSPQTGDNTSVLMYLYLILVAAGATALISRKKFKKQ